MSTKQLFDRRAAEVNATVRFHKDPTGTSHELTVDAPDGRVWMATGLHTLLYSTWLSPVSELYAQALEEIAQGTTACDDTDCEMCNDAQGDAEPHEHYRPEAAVLYTGAKGSGSWRR